MLLQVSPPLGTSIWCRITSLKFKRTLIKIILLHSCCPGNVGNSVFLLALEKDHLQRCTCV